jgi:hypothetical protein
MYYIFIENSKINGCGEGKCLNKEITNFEVSEEIYNNFIETPDKFIWNGENIINNPDYEKIKTQQKTNTRIEEILIQLKEIDEKRIRAICESEIKDETTNETWLDYYNSKAYDLRIELQSLKNQS